MKNFNLDTLLDQRKVYSHLLFLIFSSLIVLFLHTIAEKGWELENQLQNGLITFLYLETFIFLASKIFSQKVVDTTNKNFLRNILIRFLIFYLACFLSALVIIILFRFTTSLIYDHSLPHVIPNFLNNEFKVWLWSTLKGLTFGAFIFLIVQLQTALKKGRQLKEENLIFQNETLKNQINPHFLFNSLNTLSSLISSKPDVAEKFIHKFSGVYRYILENIKKSKVPLAAEFDFITDYFELHKIRDKDKILLHMDRTNENKFFIPPVSLQILIENAIKHNMASLKNPLNISVYINNDRVIVTNNLQKMAHQFVTTQTGLKNLNERIKLLSNKGLIIEESKDEFIVKMPLLI